MNTSTVGGREHAASKRRHKTADQANNCGDRSFVEDQDDRDTRQIDQMPAGTASKGTIKQVAAQKQQMTPQNTPARSTRRRGHRSTPQHAPNKDIVMLDASSDSDIDTRHEEDILHSKKSRQQCQATGPRLMRSSKKAASSKVEVVVSDSEGESSDTDPADIDGNHTDSSSSSEDQAQSLQATGAGTRSASRSKPNITAAATTSSATPRTRRQHSQSAPAAACTPERVKRSRAPTPQGCIRSTAAEGTAVMPQGQRLRAPTNTPSGRPVRSCRKGPTPSQQQQQPSLATPLAKLSLGRQLSLSTTPGKQIAASSKKGSKKLMQGSSSGPVVGDVLPHVVVDGEVFGPGDDVYLRLDEYEDMSDDEDEACEVCGSSSMKRGNAILECSTCLRGFHLRCLKPALKKVPDGDWLCTDCNAGRQPAPPCKLITRWQKLLYGKDQLALVHIVACQRGRDPDGVEEDQMLVRYYMLPQDTHVGRQKEHGARELFLGTKTFTEPACAIAGRAYVHPPSEFPDAAEEEGNDVYLCDYEYDESWKRFRRRRYHSGRDHDHDDSILPVTPGGPAYQDTLGPFTGGRSWGGHQRDSAPGFNDSGAAADDSDEDEDSEEGDQSYKPELRFACTPLTVKRKRHGQLLPAEAQAAAAMSNKFAGLGASDTGPRQELKDAFGRLHAALSLAAVPHSLPCREEERTRLQGFVKRALHEDGGVLYICGVPGTGKTALVMEVLAGMRDEAVKTGGQFVAINCLQLPSPQHVFSRLWEKLSGQHFGPARARDALMQLFGVTAGSSSSRRKYSTIIVLDEIDMLMTRDQAVLYQLFDWPNQPGSRLGIIGISNTHDLDQRVLPRIASRLDQAKLAFAPYSVSQLQEIVTGRLEASGVAGAVEDSAVQLACRKVASETGDVRRALEMLRRAVEIGRQQKVMFGVATAVATSRLGSQQQQQLPQAMVFEWREGDAALVKRQHLQTAQQEMFSALHHQLLRSRSLWEKVLLVSVVVEARATGRNAVVMQSVCERASNSIASLVDLQPPSLGLLQHVLVKLASTRLLLSDGAHIKAHVALNVDKDDLGLAIKEDERLTRLHQLL